MQTGLVPALARPDGAIVVALSFASRIHRAAVEPVAVTTDLMDLSCLSLSDSIFHFAHPHPPRSVLLGVGHTGHRCSI